MHRHSWPCNMDSTTTFLCSRRWHSIPAIWYSKVYQYSKHCELAMLISYHFSGCPVAKIRSKAARVLDTCYLGLCTLIHCRCCLGAAILFCSNAFHCTTSSGHHFYYYFNLGRAFIVIRTLLISNYFLKQLNQLIGTNFLYSPFGSKPYKWYPLSVISILVWAWHCKSLSTSRSRAGPMG